MCSYDTVDFIRLYLSSLDLQKGMRESRLRINVIHSQIKRDSLRLEYASFIGV